jgi:hypothetical protein
MVRTCHFNYYLLFCRTNHFLGKKYFMEVNLPKSLVKHGEYGDNKRKRTIKTINLGMSSLPDRTTTLTGSITLNLCYFLPPYIVGFMEL